MTTFAEYIKDYRINGVLDFPTKLLRALVDRRAELVKDYTDVEPCFDYTNLRPETIEARKIRLRKKYNFKSTDMQRLYWELNEKIMEIDKIIDAERARLANFYDSDSEIKDLLTDWYHLYQKIEDIHAMLETFKKYSTSHAYGGINNAIAMAETLGQEVLKSLPGQRDALEKILLEKTREPDIHELKSRGAIFPEGKNLTTPLSQSRDSFQK